MQNVKKITIAVTYSGPTSLATRQSVKPSLYYTRISLLLDSHYGEGDRGTGQEHQGFV
jgi:hypothetical protein